MPQQQAPRGDANRDLELAAAACHVLSRYYLLKVRTKKAREGWKGGKSRRKPPKKPQKASEPPVTRLLAKRSMMRGHCEVSRADRPGDIRAADDVLETGRLNEKQASVRDSEFAGDGRTTPASRRPHPRVTQRPLHKDRTGGDLFPFTHLTVEVYVVFILLSLWIAAIVYACLCPVGACARRLLSGVRPPLSENKTNSKAAKKY